MQKLYKLAVITFLCFNLNITLLKAQTPSCPGMEEWKFVIPVKVVNNNSVNYSDFQVIIRLNTQALVQRGIMLASGNDIRIKDSLCRQLNYWTDGVNTANTTIWTKVKTLPKNATTTIYLYFGNLCSAPAVKNGDSTFVEFDDFNFFDSTRWQKYAGGSYTVSGGSINLTTTGDIEMVHIKKRPGPFISTFKFNSYTGNFPYAGQFRKNSLTGNGLLMMGGSAINYLSISGGPPGGGYGGTAIGTGIPAATSGWGSVNWIDSANVRTMYNVTSYNGTVSPAKPTDSLQSQFGLFCCGGGGTLSVDWFGESKYAPIQPTSTVGAILRNYDFVSFNKLSFCPGMNDTLRITFKKPGYMLFNPANTFTMQLSDANGSFATPTTIKTWVDSAAKSWYLPIVKTMTPGTRYRVRVTSNNFVYNCFLSIDSFAIRPLPVPSFNIVNNNQCFRNNNYTFTATSTIPSGSIVKHYWSYGDLTKDSAVTASISHHYNNYFNKYRVILTDKSNFGCTDTISKIVTIKEMPTAAFTMDKDIQCLRGNKFVFRSQSSSFTEAFSLKWRFGDGDTATTADSAKHTYKTAGNFQIKLIVKTNTGGCSDTTTLYNLVNVHPVAQFTVNDTDQCYKNHKFKYVNTSTISSGVGMRTYWNMGNGAIDSLKDTIYQTYGSVTNYNVRLIVLSDDGCYDTTKHKVYLFPMPVASFLINNSTQCAAGNSFGFRAKSTVTPAGVIKNNWLYGDGNSVNNLDTTTHSYLLPGTYKVILRSYTNNGCLDTAFKSVTINPTPKGSMTVNKTVQCAKGNVFKLKSTSTISSGTFTKRWDLGDGSPIEVGDSIKYTYTAQGVYHVKLLLNSDKNCADTVLDTVTVNVMPAPSANITSADAQCLPGNLFQFANASSIPSGSITNIRWEYGDGSFDNNVNTPSHTYAVDGKYDVLLITTSNLNCKDTAVVKIDVYEKPDANFSINDTDQCLKTNNFIFTDLTYAGAGHTNSWDFGDGKTSAQLSPSKKYTTDNQTFTVTLIATSGDGCTDTVTKKVLIFPQPKPSFTIDNPAQCLKDNIFTFTSTSYIVSGNYTHAWAFDDGNTFGNINTTTHSYNTFNTVGKPTYRVQLTLTSNNGCIDTFIRPVRVYPMPVASFAIDKPDACLGGNTFQFGATSTLYNSGTMIHDWDLGDNTTQSNIANFSHVYANYNTYKITLISTSAVGGCKDTAYKSVDVYPMPVAGFTVDNDSQCLKGNVFNFTNTTAIPAGSVAQNNWNFGDTITDNNVSTTHSYATPRTATVTLIVTSDHNCMDTASAVVVTHPMPHAAFKVSPKTMCFDKNAFSVTNNSSILGGTIATHDWDWGDGNHNNTQSPPPYNYANSGLYTIILTETTQYGCFDTAHASIEVFPDPNIDFDVAAVCLKDSSEFINNTTVASGTITSYKWLFGDGKSSTLQNPKHKYRFVGNYDITLVAVTDKGCRDTLKDPGKAVVNPLPKAKFTYVKLRSWEKETDVQFIDSSSADAISWLWNFGNGNTSTDQNPLEYYTDTANSIISLVVANGFGCHDTSAQRILIAPDVVYFMPSAFSPNADNLNDTYKPVGLAYAQAYKFIIFDRWGEVMFKTSNPQDSWDGKYLGEVVQQGTYYYRLEFVGVDTLRREEKGYILILR